MPRPSLPFFAPNPLLLWADYAFKTTEMLFASGQVIGHRTSRMANAGVIPSLRDRKEFTLMGQEKLEAAAESAQAVLLRSITLNMQMSMALFNQMASVATGMLALAGSRTALQGTTLHAELLRDALIESGKTTTHLNSSLVHMASHALKPIHSRATANARRLAKIKK